MPTKPTNQAKPAGKKPAGKKPASKKPSTSRTPSVVAPAAPVAASVPVVAPTPAPAAVTPVNPTPPPPATPASRASNAGNGWFKKNWLTGALAILLLLLTWNFFSKKNKEGKEEAQTATSSEQGIWERRAAEAEARASEMEAQAQAEAKARQDEIVFQEKLEAAKREHIAKLIESPKARISEVRHNPNEGGVVRSLSAPKKKNGSTYQLLHTEAGTGRRKVLMYPASRPLQEISENLSFSGLKPPAGELAPFDTVEDPDWGPMTVYAWKLK